MPSASAPSARPLVAVVCCGGVAAGRGVQFVSDRFLAPLAAVGASAVLVPAIASVVDAATLTGRFDALLMTGSASNVSPARYGSGAIDAAADPQRDEVALSLASAMIDAGRPVLGICRGMQELNVLFGGTLATLDDVRSLHMSGTFECPSSLDHVHGVELVGPVLSRGSPASVEVSSVHRQGVDRLGAGLTVEAVAPDGLVEAFSARPAGSVVGVQWHPETLRSPVDLRLFEDLARAA